MIICFFNNHGQMMETPYISIITPCYNGSKFIGDAINSLIQQPLREFELIVVNDGSTDETEKICEIYSKKDKRVKCLTIENSGAGYARNYGMRQAHGRWIMFLDADDLYLNNCLNDSFVNQLREYEAQNIDVVYSAKCMTDMSVKKECKIICCGNMIDTNNIPTMEFWAAIYQKEFLQLNNVMFYEYKRQDIESAFRYLAYSNSQKIIVNDKMIFYVQRMNPQSNTHTWNLQVLHEVKCLVYNDLYKNHYTNESICQLKTIMLHELIGYYEECCNLGIYSVDALKNMNKIMCEQIHMWKENRNLIGRRNCLKCVGLFLRANISKKKYTMNVSGKQTIEPNLGQDNNLFLRLKYLSKFVHSVMEG